MNMLSNTKICGHVNSRIPSSLMTPNPLFYKGKFGHRMKVTLSGDHRAIDVATGAQFLQIVKLLLERPLTLML